jgi:hypothetical protein
MFREDDIQYALETTRILLEPDRRIDTFGATAFQFSLVTESMDEVNQVRVRDGRIEAGRPTIVTPDLLQEMKFEGFGEQAERFARWWKEHGPDLAILKYGFQFRKTDISEHIVHEPMEIVRERVLADARQANNPLLAVIEGVEDAWEISLLKFSLDMIQKSRGINLFDFKRRGLL